MIQSLSRSTALTISKSSDTNKFLSSNLTKLVGISFNGSLSLGAINRQQRGLMTDRVDCAILRTGTSKAIFFNIKNMPKDINKWSPFLLDVMGSPDSKQIDGLGGATSLTSKVAIVGKSKHSDCDVEYTYAQVSPDSDVVDFKANCGNVSCGVGVFAVEEGLVRTTDPKTQLVFKNMNTGSTFKTSLETRNGKHLASGNSSIPGVPGFSSPIDIEIDNPLGAVTGYILPSGKAIEVFNTSYGPIEVTIVDSVNPVVFAKADSIGHSDIFSELSVEKLALLEEIRCIAAEKSGICDFDDASKESPVVPKVAIIANPATYLATNGETISKDNCDLLIRMTSLKKPHASLAVSVGMCAATAAKIHGSLVNKLFSPSNDEVKLGNPAGIMTLKCKGSPIHGDAVLSVERTARIIMKGEVFTKDTYDVNK